MNFGDTPGELRTCVGNAVVTTENLTLTDPELEGFETRIHRTGDPDRVLLARRCTRAGDAVALHQDAVRLLELGLGGAS